MQKTPHPVARLAYTLTLWLNPNNHAYDGGRASSIMEQEAIGEIARMVGWPDSQGHLCGGGTLANFEALWVAREQHPGKAIAASSQAHYTHERLSSVLGVPFRSIAAGARGTRSGFMSTPPTAATSHWPTTWTRTPGRRSTALRRPTPWPSTRTSTGSSPTAAVACCSAIPPSGITTVTTRPTPTCAWLSCFWVFFPLFVSVLV